MSETRCSKLVKRVEAFCLIMILLIISFTPETVHAETNYKKVEQLDFADFSNWRSGVYYHTNGQYVSNSNRICLNDYVTFSSDKFKVHITDGEFRLLIRELNSNKNFVKSATLMNGQVYEPGNSTVYLAISLYKYNADHQMSYKAFGTKFANGFVAELLPVQETASSGTTGTTNSTEQDATTGTTNSTEQGTVTDTTTNNSEQKPDKTAVEEIEFTNFASWRTGYYHYQTGKYESNGSRICLNDYVTFENDEYTVNINKSGYQMLIREMDENMKFIKSYNLENGKTYTPSSKAIYLGISLYKVNEVGISYKIFKNLFEEGFQATLQATEDDFVVTFPDSEIEEEENNSTDDNANVTNKTFYECFKEALVNGDSSVIDVSAYKVKDTELYITHWPKLKEECFIEHHSGHQVYPELTVENGYIKTFQFRMDDDFANRVKRVRQSVNEYLNMVDSRMSDLEKTLLAHEFVVKRTHYNLKDNIAYTAGGVLGNGYAVCSGYADAMVVLLREVGVEVVTANSTSMNHCWVYVNIDGNWYHIDPTWDDTRAGSQSRNSHRYFLRNDNEFGSSMLGTAHYGWKCSGANATSNSTKYENWYVHDVAGTMYYYNGMWYYLDINSNSILCSNIEGTVTKVVVDGSNLGTISLTGISGNVLSYKIGTTQYSRTL